MRVSDYFADLFVAGRFAWNVYFPHRDRERMGSGMGVLKAGRDEIAVQQARADNFAPLASLAAETRGKPRREGQQ